MASWKLFAWQFLVWLLAVILWGVAHAGEPGLALPVLAHLALLGLAAYLVVRPALRPQLAFSVGDCFMGVVWALASEGAGHAGDNGGLVVAATLVHVLSFGFSLYALRLLKKEEEAVEAAMLAESLPPAAPPPL